MKTKPLFIVISAPSGCGKSTLIDMLLQEYPELIYSISCTTRAPRGDEEDGIDYHFLSVERFRELIAEDAFLEYAEVHGNYYGTLRAPIEEILAEGNSAILDIDVAGAAPSMEALRERLEKRGTDSPEVIERRLANAEGEMARAPEYMYQVTNDDLAIAYKRLCDLIEVRAGRM